MLILLALVLFARRFLVFVAGFCPACRSTNLPAICNTDRKVSSTNTLLCRMPCATERCLMA